ncbi:U-box domain-containing protein 33 [Striga hermonthica]|uniref:RING-type E3 ubiquitin transferase n=1 Tax=Striga hermonthica TaxID=68872 RepID=A0A9N7NGY3_STRHE|nr:U-box domain-containing protein 33 [Striga hermonthica]
MGSEGVAGDLSSPVYVAVGRDVKEGKLLLTWVAESFPEKDICLVHVHQPTSLVSLLNGKLSASKLKNHAVKACQEFERSKMEKLLQQYFLFLSQMGKQAEKVCIEMKNIEKGIIQLINRHKITQLVMGAGSETFNTKKFSETISSKAMVICQQAPVSCHIWFISKGCLLYSRPVGPGCLFTTNTTTSPSTSSGGASLRNTNENVNVNSANVKYSHHPTTLTDELGSPINESTDPMVRHSSGNSSPLSINGERLEHIPSSPSNNSLESEFQDKGICDLRSPLEQSVIDALDALRKAKAAERFRKEEIIRSREIEEQLLKQRQETETMKSQHDHILKEIQLIQDQNLALESRLRESYSSEEKKELEDKIVQAVNLLITFKGARDKLQTEYDSAVSEVNKYKALQTQDHPARILDAHFFGISFSDIIEATQNFSPSQKIGDGRYGSVFKGVLCHVKVAIKMLPSSASQSDSEFKNETELLGRVRHPNLVTLVGACPESRSLVYEYIENGSLEDYLSTLPKNSLSWQTRIRIAAETCSALLFLHASHSCHLHGNLKPSKILLDKNFVTKISGFGIYNLISHDENLSSQQHTFLSENDPEKLAYVDPKYFEDGMLTTESDVYSFGVIILRLLTARRAMAVVRDVKWALESGNLETVLDVSAGDWPVELAVELAGLGLRCCQVDRLDRPDLESEVWAVLEPMRELCCSSQLSSTTSCMGSSSQHNKIPSHFLCPIFQEVMKDPHIAPDGFTYEADAIKGWFNSGHKTSPMTNLKLDNCDLLPNYALYYAIQEWQQQNT